MFGWRCTLAIEGRDGGDVQMAPVILEKWVGRVRSAIVVEGTDAGACVNHCGILTTAVVGVG